MTDGTREVAVVSVAALVVNGRSVLSRGILEDDSSARVGVVSDFVVLRRVLSDVMSAVVSVECVSRSACVVKRSAVVVSEVGSSVGTELDGDVLVSFVVVVGTVFAAVVDSDE